MKWSQFGLKRKSIQEIIKENEKGYPLYEFLSFLMDYRGEHDLAIGITGDWRETNIQEIRVRFKNEETQIFKMGEFPVFDYGWFLKRPEMLLEHFSNDAQLVSARVLYDDIQAVVRNHKETIENYRNEGPRGLYRFLHFSAHVDMEKLKGRREQAIHNGALFCERLNELYQEYQDVANLPSSESTPVPELSPPVRDVVEVELLTILEDPDISDLTKSDAQETLELYRQEKTAVERNPKEENARLAIQTIRKYYTKSGQEATG